MEDSNQPPNNSQIQNGTPKRESVKPSIVLMKTKIWSFFKVIKTEFGNRTKYPKILLGSFFLIILVLISASFLYFQNQKVKGEIITQNTGQLTSTPILNEEVQEDDKENIPEILTTPTRQLTQKQTAIPTEGVTAPTSSCNYNLNVATGSVKVNIQAQSGILIGDQFVELQAQSGCKVLVNQSSDIDTRIARQGNPSVDFSTVPPGTYSVRVRYKDQWTGYKSTSVSSGQLTTITIYVSGDTPTNTPTPTPKPKPICYDPIVYPSPTGVAPYTAKFQGQGSSGAAGYVVHYEWDFESSGSWYTDGTTNPPSHTFQNPGSYIVRMRLLASNGEYSNVCQTTVTATQ